MSALPAPAVPLATAALSVRQAPRREPPFDDESDPRLLTRMRGQAELPFMAAGWPRPAARRPFDRAYCHTAGTGPADPAAWARRLLVAILEVRAGRRPVGQLSAQLSAGVLAGLSRELGRHSIHSRRTARLQSVHVCRPAPGVAEVAAVVHQGRRVHAVALRLETRQGRWRCVRLHLG
ncbi:MAG: hypothetical protein JO147_13975 [Actinobacteria bacterium]|nr:hypothetical protein [Actinomycetota bacterium]